MSAIPVLQTERLILHGWRESDFDAYVTIFCDPEVTRFISKPQSRADAWRHMAMIAGHWSLIGYGPWAVIRRSDGELIGRIGFWNPEFWPALELIWAMGRAHWGNGYASEGARAAMDYGFEQLSFANITSHIDPENIRSQAVAKRLGQKPVGTVKITVMGEQFDTVAWEISREAWADHRAKP